MDEQLSRILEIIRHFGYKPTRFEKKCGLSNGSITNQIRHEGNVGNHVITKVCDTFHVNPNWIKEGNGPVFLCKKITDYIVQTLFENEHTIRDFENANNNVPGTFNNAFFLDITNEQATLWVHDLQKYLPDADYSWFLCNPGKIQNEKIKLYTNLDTASLAKGHNKNDTPINIYSLRELFPSASFLYIVNSDNMAPLINKGEYVICSDCHKPEKWIWGDIYLIIEKDSTTLIRRVISQNDQGDILCSSENAGKYADIKIEVDRIETCAKVLGHIEFFQ